MPSFDITSEADMVALKNSVDVADRQIGNRYDFKGTSAKVELNEKDKVITLFGDSDFQPDSSKRLDLQDVQKVSGNKAKQEMKIKDGIDSDLAKKLVKLIKDSGLKVQASIQGDTVRVNGAKRDVLQEAIAHVKKSVTDFPLKFGNFRD